MSGNYFIKQRLLHPPAQWNTLRHIREEIENYLWRNAHGSSFAGQRAEGKPSLVNAAVTRAQRLRDTAKDKVATLS